MSGLLSRRRSPKLRSSCAPDLRPQVFNVVGCLLRRSRFPLCGFSPSYDHCLRLQVLGVWAGFRCSLAVLHLLLLLHFCEFARLHLRSLRSPGGLPPSCDKGMQCPICGGYAFRCCLLSQVPLASCSVDPCDCRCFFVADFPGLRSLLASRDFDLLMWILVCFFVDFCGLYVALCMYVCVLPKGDSQSQDLPV